MEIYKFMLLTQNYTIREKQNQDKIKQHIKQILDLYITIINFI